MQKFGECSEKPRTHFTHLIKPYQQEVHVRPYLVTLMVHGTAAFSANDFLFCKLSRKEDSPQFTIPIVWIMFALSGENAFVQQQIYASPKDDASTLDANEFPQFTSYNF